jgi:hypothetical protein
MRFEPPTGCGFAEVRPQSSAFAVPVHAEITAACARPCASHATIAQQPAAIRLGVNPNSKRYV